MEYTFQVVAYPVRNLRSWEGTLVASADSLQEAIELYEEMRSKACAMAHELDVVVKYELEAITGVGTDEEEYTVLRVQWIDDCTCPGVLHG